MSEGVAFRRKSDFFLNFCIFFFAFIARLETKILFNSWTVHFWGCPSTYNWHDFESGYFYTAFGEAAESSYGREGGLFNELKCAFCSGQIQNTMKCKRLNPLLKAAPSLCSFNKDAQLPQHSSVLHEHSGHPNWNCSHLLPQCESG